MVDEKSFTPSNIDVVPSFGQSLIEIYKEYKESLFKGKNRSGSTPHKKRRKRKK